MSRALLVFGARTSLGKRKESSHRQSCCPRLSWPYFRDPLQTRPYFRDPPNRPDFTIDPVGDSGMGRAGWVGKFVSRCGDSSHSNTQTNVLACRGHPEPSPCHSWKQDPASNLKEPKKLSKTNSSCTELGLRIF